MYRRGGGAISRVLVSPTAPPLSAGRLRLVATAPPNAATPQPKPSATAAAKKEPTVDAAKKEPTVGSGKSEPPRSGFGAGTAFLLTAVPIAAALYYFREDLQDILVGSKVQPPSPRKVHGSDPTPAETRKAPSVAAANVHVINVVDVVGNADAPHEEAAAAGMEAAETLAAEKEESTSSEAEMGAKEAVEEEEKKEEVEEEEEEEKKEKEKEKEKEQAEMKVDGPGEGTTAPSELQFEFNGGTLVSPSLPPLVMTAVEVPEAAPAPQAEMVAILLADDAESEWKRQLVLYVQRLEDQRLALSRQVDSLRRELVANVEERERELRAEYERQLATIRRDAIGAMKRYAMALEANLMTRSAQELNQRLEEGRFQLVRDMQDKLQTYMEVFFQKMAARELERAELLARADQQLERMALRTSSELDFRARIEAFYKAAYIVSTMTLAAGKHHEPLRQQTAALAELAPVDEVFGEAARVLEASLIAARGVASKQALLERFATVSKFCRRTAMVSPGADFWNYVVAAMVDRLKIVLPLSPADDDGEDGGSEETATFRRVRLAQYHVDHEDLASAAAELDQLPPGIRPIAAEWISEVRRRALLEMTLQLLHAELDANLGMKM
jgi:hypothetical protein